MMFNVSAHATFNVMGQRKRKEVRRMTTNYQEMYKGCAAVYTDKKNAARIGAIISNCEKAGNGFKFQVLKSADNFAGNKEQFKDYKEACDNYMKSLYSDLGTKSRDKALTAVLCELSATSEQIDKVVKANIHKTLIKNTLRNRQNMTEEGKERLAAIRERKLLLEEEGKKLDEEGNAIELSETAAEEETEKIKADLKELYASQVFEAAELCQVTMGTFIKSLELFIGNLLSDKNVITGYVTLEQREFNQKWKRTLKQARAVEISEEEFMKYWEKNDIAGLKSLINEKRAEQEAAQEAKAE